MNVDAPVSISDHIAFARVDADSDLYAVTVAPVLDIKASLELGDGGDGVEWRCEDQKERISFCRDHPTGCCLNGLPDDLCVPVEERPGGRSELAHEKGGPLHIREDESHYACR
jgi:hypothetical protein